MKRQDFISKIHMCKELVMIGPLINIMELPKIDPSFPIIYIDGGLEFKKYFPHNLNHYSIGDGDSYQFQHDLTLDELLPNDKDYSDFRAALSLITNNIEHILCLGLTGGRYDHQLSIIGELFDFLSHYKKSMNITLEQFGEFFSAGRYSFNHHGIFSIFSLYPIKLSIVGNCEYPLNQKFIGKSLSSHTLSNSADGDFEIHCDRPFVFMRQKN